MDPATAMALQQGMGVLADAKAAEREKELAQYNAEMEKRKNLMALMASLDSKVYS